MPHLDWTINVPSLVTWGLLVVGVVWKASRLVTQVEDLIESFRDHEERDDKRFEGLSGQVHSVAIDVARLTGGKTR